MTGDVWHPAHFQGRGKQRRYFEGWYYKVVDRSEAAAFAIIPGISLGRDPSTSHAFVMVLDAREHRLLSARYPPGDFTARARPFGLEIGPNRFGLDGLSLDYKDGGARLRAELRFSGTVPWPVKLLSPGVMGWYAFVPGMECYHGVLSFDHAVEGFVDVGGERVEMGGGRGYIEKDWGRSMPSAWIWMQTNHFDEAGVSLTGSIARIPWFGRAFTGHIFGLYLRGRLYRFTTYTGARIDRVEMAGDQVQIALEDRAYRLTIGADRTGGVELPAPRLGEMTARAAESLRSRIDVGLYRKARGGDEVVFSGTGRNAGLEIVGDPAGLLSGPGRRPTPGRP